jgi:hypothetical protein
VGESKGVGRGENVRSDGDEIVLVLVGVSELSGMCRETVGRVFLQTFGIGGFLFSCFLSLSVCSKLCLLVIEFSRESVAEQVERVQGLLDEATLGMIPLQSPR